MTVKGLEKGCAKRSCWKQYGKAIKVEEAKVVDLALERFYNQKD
jgi:hypothetical protein